MQETLIEAENISYSYPSQFVGKRSDKTGKKRRQEAAVKGVSFSIKRGEIVGFLGPNGAGKSTTMRLISGNLVPAQGSISISDYDLFEHPLQAKQQIGYLPDTPPLYKELSVDEYLQFCANIHAMNRNEVAARLSYVKQRCGLEQQGKRIISHLSKGFQQRVGIAQAIIHQPALIILDEPTVGLDPNQSFEIRELIKELGETHSVLISTHNLSEVQEICHSVQIMHQGELILKESIAGLRQHMDNAEIYAYFNHHPDASLLEKVPGVYGVKQENEGWQILFRQNEKQSHRNVAQAIVQLAIEQGWGLYEIYKQNCSLESVFMRLTRESGQQKGQANKSPSKEDEYAA